MTLIVYCIFCLQVRFIDDHYIFRRDDHPQRSKRSADHHTSSLISHSKVSKFLCTYHKLGSYHFFTGRGAACLWSRIVNFFCPPFYTWQKYLPPLLAYAEKRGPPFGFREKKLSPLRSNIPPLIALKVQNKKWPPSWEKFWPTSLTHEKKFAPPPLAPWKKIGHPQTTPKKCLSLSVILSDLGGHWASTERTSFLHRLLSWALHLILG